jgi:lysozyme
MNIERLMSDLEEDEGFVAEIYLDHLGHPTFGIGHLITENDPEFGKDIESVISDCQKLFDDFDGLPEEAQLVIANMMFNLGFPRLSKFSKMVAAANQNDWPEMANQMVDSRWYKQVTNRASRLERRIRSLA